MANILLYDCDCDTWPIRKEDIKVKALSIVIRLM